MDTEDIMTEIDIKYGELIEHVPQKDVIPLYIKILLGMLVETRMTNKYLKERLDKCQQ